MAHYFLGIPLPNEVRAHLFQLAEKIHDRFHYGYWTDQGDYHITLSFLGEVSPEQLKELSAHLQGQSQDMHPAELQLSGFGTFGKRDQPRVLWMGVKADSYLYDLQTLVKNAVAASGLETESRAYRPHITIAKKWRGESSIAPDQWEKFIPAYEPFQWTAKAIRLFQVEPKKTPRYIPIQEFHLY